MGPVSAKLLEAGMRWERDALAACVAHPELAGILAELGPEHFDDPLHRRLRDHLVQPGEVEPELLRCWPSSTRERRPKGSTSRPASSSCCGSASDGSSGSWTRRTWKT